MTTLLVTSNKSPASFNFTFSSIIKVIKIGAKINIIDITTTNAESLNKFNCFGRIALVLQKNLWLQQSL
ncbi:hypothetical protein [Chroococcidiopsis sp. SAG 2025]|uniref:hypothetical protein n=1 Tax=Chroococcidiopsis sp. SAG 2025 TaxID=171389 RepID=UPI002936E5C2|nr:hypothetical protein [Chroococcidiopsis sp. SAG 2025]